MNGPWFIWGKIAVPRISLTLDVARNPMIHAFCESARDFGEAALQKAAS